MEAKPLIPEHPHICLTPQNMRAWGSWSLVATQHSCLGPIPSSPQAPRAAGTPGLTTLLEGLIRPVPAVPDRVAHFVHGDAFAAVALEFSGALAKSHYENQRRGSGVSERWDPA